MAPRRLLRLNGREGAAARAYLVRGLPASYLFDRNQVLLGRAIGAREWDSKEARVYIQALLGKGQ